MALSQFHGSVKETMRIACENALLKEGFVPDPLDENETDSGENMSL